MQIAGTPDDLELSGWDGAGGDERPLFALGSAGAAAAVRFAASGDGRLVAPAGDGLWRRAPWPVRDALFELEPAGGRRILVVGAPAVAERLRTLGAEVEACERLTVDLLRGAAVAVLLRGDGALPEQAPCVLAARRVLVTDAAAVTFGLQPGVDYLLAATPDEAAERAHTAAAYPDAVAWTRALGAGAVAHQRASLVYPQLAADLAATAPPRSAAPRG